MFSGPTVTSQILIHLRAEAFAQRSSRALPKAMLARREAGLEQQIVAFALEFVTGIKALGLGKTADHGVE